MFIERNAICNDTFATASKTQFRSISLWHISTHRISALSLLLSGSALEPEMSMGTYLHDVSMRDWEDST